MRSGERTAGNGDQDPAGLRVGTSTPVRARPHRNTPRRLPHRSRRRRDRRERVRRMRYRARSGTARTAPAGDGSTCIRHGGPAVERRIRSTTSPTASCVLVTTNASSSNISSPSKAPSRPTSPWVTTARCVPELEQLVAAHPAREFFWRALMLALYRSGRAAAALMRTQHSEVCWWRSSDSSRPLTHSSSSMTVPLDTDPALDPPSRWPPTNLSTPLDSFVDRTVERRSVISLLKQHRLVTVLGVGGVGKSRLANEVGRALVDVTPGGVWWIDLAPESDDVSFVALTASAMDLGTSAAGSIEVRAAQPTAASTSPTGTGQLRAPHDARSRLHQMGHRQFTVRACARDSRVAIDVRGSPAGGTRAPCDTDQRWRRMLRCRRALRRPTRRASGGGATRPRRGRRHRRPGRWSAAGHRAGGRPMRDDRARPTSPERSGSTTSCSR